MSEDTIELEFPNEKLRAEFVGWLLDGGGEADFTDLLVDGGGPSLVSEMNSDSLIVFKELAHD